MENTPQQAVVPLEQGIVLFHGHEMLLVRLSDDRVAATLSSLCAMLGIYPRSQASRIRRNKVLAQYLLLVPIKTAGGSQRMDVLISEAIHDWLLGVQIEQVATEKRPLILALQIEAVAVSYRHFFGEQATQPPPEPRATPLPSPPYDIVDSPWDRLFEGLDDIQEALHALRQDEQAKDRRLVAVEEWLTSLDRRVAGTNQSRAANLGWIPLLSVAHLADVLELFRSLERATGRTQIQLEQELLETFRTRTISAIPDEQWPDVLAWCIWRAQQPL